MKNTNIDIRIKYSEDDIIYKRLIQPWQDQKYLSAFVMKAIELYFFNSDFKKFFMKSVDDDYSDLINQFNNILAQQRDALNNLEAGQQRLNNLHNEDYSLNDGQTVSPECFNLPDGFMPSDISNLTIFDLPAQEKVEMPIDLSFDFQPTAEPVDSVMDSYAHLSGMADAANEEKIKDFFTDMLKEFSSEFLDIDDKSFSSFVSNFENKSKSVLNAEMGLPVTEQITERIEAQTAPVPVTVTADVNTLFDDVPDVTLSNLPSDSEAETTVDNEVTFSKEMMDDLFNLS